MYPDSNPLLPTKKYDQRLSILYKDTQSFSEEPHEKNCLRTTRSEPALVTWVPGSLGLCSHLVGW